MMTQQTETATDPPTRAVCNDDTAFRGYHSFPGKDGGGLHGSFEVFHSSDYSQDADGVGWYWWCCWPGCIPDGEASGPFPTAQGAYLDAIGD